MKRSLKSMRVRYALSCFIVLIVNVRQYMACNPSLTVGRPLLVEVPEEPHVSTLTGKISLGTYNT